MRQFVFSRLTHILLVTLVFASLGVRPVRPVSAQDDFPTSPWELISQTNAMRSAYGLSELIVDPILMTTAQVTAETMAANLSCSHLGGVSQRVAAYGFGAGGNVFVTENIMCAYGPVGDLYATVWADPDHMIPMTAEWAAYYKYVGAGAARDPEGKVYYVLHVGYFSGGSYSPGTAVPSPVGGNQVPGVTAAPTGDQRVFSVVTATPGTDGSILHEVKPGQTAWSIAIAYGITIADLVAFNPTKLTSTRTTVYVGQKLLVRGPATPTISPTVTETPRPPTRTPRPSHTPEPTRPTETPTISPTPTRPPLFPQLPSLEEGGGSRRLMGYGLIAICGLGLLMVALSALRRRPPAE